MKRYQTAVKLDAFDIPGDLKKKLLSLIHSYYSFFSNVFFDDLILPKLDNKESQIFCIHKKNAFLLNNGSTVRVRSCVE